MRTLKQLESNLKDGYRITGTEIWVVDAKGNKITCKVGTVKSFIDKCIKKGLVK